MSYWPPSQGAGGSGGARGEWDYFLYSPDGSNVYVYDGSTGGIVSTGTDWVVLLNSLIAAQQTSDVGDAVKGFFWVHPNVPPSTTQLLIANRSGITVYCPKREGGYSTETRPPRTYKILMQAVTTILRRIFIHGLQFYEIEIQHSAQNVRAITMSKCSSQDWSSIFPGRRGLRFTGSGAGGIEHVSIEDHYAAIVNAGQAATDPTSLISFESASLVTGHIEFRNFFGENPGFGTSCAVAYRNGGRTGPRVDIAGSIAALSAPAGFAILRTNINQAGGVQDAGPSELVFSHPHIEMQSSNTNVCEVLDNPGVGSYFNVIFEKPRFTHGNFAYQWVTNVNTGSFVGQPVLQVNGGGAFGAGGASHSWAIGTPGNIQFLPRGWQAIDTTGGATNPWFIPGHDNRSGLTVVDGAVRTIWPNVPSLAWGGGVLMFRVHLHMMATAYTSGTFIYRLTWQEGGQRTQDVTAAALNVPGIFAGLIKPTTGTSISIQLVQVGVGTVTVGCIVEPVPT